QQQLPPQHQQEPQRPQQSRPHANFASTTGTHAHLSPLLPHSAPFAYNSLPPASDGHLNMIHPADVDDGGESLFPQQLPEGGHAFSLSHQQQPGNQPGYAEDGVGGSFPDGSSNGGLDGGYGGEQLMLQYSGGGEQQQQQPESGPSGDQV
ncbi:unnamed protein product, partial [Ectocarpus fasciculatus]